MPPIQRTSKPVGRQPPIVSGTWPIIGAGFDWVKNPSKFLNKQREKHGDIFLLHAFGLKLFCVFSKAGLRDFYKVPETHASFTEATRGFLGYKVTEGGTEDSFTVFSLPSASFPFSMFL